MLVYFYSELLLEHANITLSERIVNMVAVFAFEDRLKNNLGESYTKNTIFSTTDTVGTFNSSNISIPIFIILEKISKVTFDNINKTESLRSCDDYSTIKFDLLAQCDLHVSSSLKII